MRRSHNCSTLDSIWRARTATWHQVRRRCDSRQEVRTRPFWTCVYRTPREAPPARASAASIDASAPMRTMIRLRMKIPPFVRSLRTPQPAILRAASLREIAKDRGPDLRRSGASSPSISTEPISRFQIQELGSGRWHPTGHRRWPTVTRREIPKPRRIKNVPSRRVRRHTTAITRGAFLAPSYRSLSTPRRSRTRSRASSTWPSYT